MRECGVRPPAAEPSPGISGGEVGPSPVVGSQPAAERASWREQASGTRMGSHGKRMTHRGERMADRSERMANHGARVASRGARAADASNYF